MFMPTSVFESKKLFQLSIHVHLNVHQVFDYMLLKLSLRSFNDSLLIPFMFMPDTIFETKKVFQLSIHVHLDFLDNTQHLNS